MLLVQFLGELREARGQFPSEFTKLGAARQPIGKTVVLALDVLEFTSERRESFKPPDASAVLVLRIDPHIPREGVVVGQDLELPVEESMAPMFRDRFVDGEELLVGCAVPRFGICQLREKYSTTCHWLLVICMSAAPIPTSEASVITRVSAE